MAESSVTVTTYTCDRCGASQDKPFRSRPKVRLTYDLHDYQGAAVAGYDQTWDLCGECLSDVIAALTDPAAAVVRCEGHMDGPKHQDCPHLHPHEPHVLSDRIGGESDG